MLKCQAKKGFGAGGGKKSKVDLHFPELQKTSQQCQEGPSDRSLVKWQCFQDVTEPPSRKHSWQSRSIQHLAPTFINSSLSGMPLLLQRRQYGPDLEEDDPSWIRVGRLTDFKVCRAGLPPCMHLTACLHACLLHAMLLSPSTSHASLGMPVSHPASLQDGKQTRAVILPDNTAIVLYRTPDDEVYCSDANSTAYKFPMIDANVIESKPTLLKHT